MRSTAGCRLPNEDTPISGLCAAGGSARPPPRHAGHRRRGVGERGAGDAVERNVADGRKHGDVAFGDVPLHRRGGGDRRHHRLGKRQRQRPHDGAGHGRAIGAADAEHAGDGAGTLPGTDDLGSARDHGLRRLGARQCGERGHDVPAAAATSAPPTSAKLCACGRSDRSTSHGVTPASAARRTRSAPPRACCRAWREPRLISAPSRCLDLVSRLARANALHRDTVF